MRRYVANLSVDPAKLTKNHVVNSDEKHMSKPRSRAKISSVDSRLECGTPIESYFTHQKPTQQILRYSPRHWNSSVSLQSAANSKDLSEEQSDECL